MHGQRLGGRPARQRLTRLLAAIVAGGLALVYAGCGQAQPSAKAQPATSPQQTALGKAHVEIFVPADIGVLPPSAPVNRWDNLAAAISAQLEKAGYGKDSIRVVSSDSLAAQAQALANHVADHKAGSGAGAHDLVILVPAISLPAAATQFGGLLGDPVSQPGSLAAAADSLTQLEAAEQTGSVFASGSAAGSVGPTDNSQDAHQEHVDAGSTVIRTPTWKGGLNSVYSGQGLSTPSAAERTELEKQIAANKKAETAVAEACAKLRAKQSSLVLLSRALPKVLPNVFVETPSAYEIGETQARQLASKLELSEASAADPKRVEIVLPNGDPQTDQAFFAGVWAVLGPYFSKGVVISPSGRLGKKSSQADWVNLLVASGSAADTQKDFASVLEVAREIYLCHAGQGHLACPVADDVYTDASFNARTQAQGKAGAVVPLDGVIAANDFLAAQVTTVLSQQGYTGSAADINPDITIGGIIGNLTGSGDLMRRRVPKPAKTGQPSQAPTSHPTDPEKSPETPLLPGLDSAQWPIVVGWGSSQTNVQLVVAGKQWMTGLADRAGLAKDIVAAGKSLSLTHTVSLPGRPQVGLDGRKVPLVVGRLVPVAASNLKAALIDTGYLSAADAGL